MRTFDILKKFIETKNYRNIEVFNCGVWNEKTTLYFSISDDVDGSSRIVEKSEEEIKMDKIDNIVGDEKVTFIKMDIEGAELNALEGATETIKKCTPTLAICVYHKSEDLITIPQFIKNSNPNYKFYLRHHGNKTNPVGELVLYAIP